MTKQANLFIKKVFWLLIASVGVVFSQFDYATTWPSRWKIGIDGGPSLITLFGNPISEKAEKGTIGGQAGFYFNYKFQNVVHPDSTTKSSIHSSLQFGIYYDRRGAFNTPQSLESAGFLPGNKSHYTNFDYLTIPILAHFMVGRGNRVKVYQTIGPYFSILLNEETRIEHVDSGTSFRNETSNYHPIDIGIALSFGLEIPIQQQFFITVEARQYLGLFNINKNGFPKGGYLQHSVTQFMAGIAFRLPTKKTPRTKVDY